MIGVAVCSINFLRSELLMGKAGVKQLKQKEDCSFWHRRRKADLWWKRWQEAVWEHFA